MHLSLLDPIGLSSLSLEYGKILIFLRFKIIVKTFTLRIEVAVLPAFVSYLRVESFALCFHTNLSMYSIVNGQTEEIKINHLSFH
jgi:riboflavin transporter FmnP